MGIECGSQVTLCDIPIRFDTYKGCSHACAYCFVKRKTDISKIEAQNCIKQLANFIKGERTKNTNWCDWAIPLHWGGMSDPFQPCERKHRISYNCLKLLAETKYPFAVSTKGKLICEPEYLELLKQCNAVVQVSMVCSKYDKLEKGCPTYEERLKMVKTLSKNCKRVIIRIQPYMLEVFKDVMENIPRLAEAGAYGITIEGMKFITKKNGLVKVGGDYCYPESLLKHDFEIIKERCHKYGLKFYCAENRLRYMGDHLCCCGVGGLEGFKTNTYNNMHLRYDKEKVEPTKTMCEVGTAQCFLNGFYQSTAGLSIIKKNSFKDMMLIQLEKEEKQNK